MYCKNCGSQIDDRAVVCPHCGVPVYDNYNTNQFAPYSKPAKEYNVLAILGFIFSILGTGSIIMGIAGLVCSIIGFKQAEKLHGHGKGLAIAGIVISIVAIVLQAVSIVLDIIDLSYIYTYDYNYYY
ncbi:MAG: DUF4190 domain-containing protein [Clostridia bacterium]|nr:DUF4190 domain-containing protein [Clostridia bacterium]